MIENQRLTSREAYQIATEYVMATADMSNMNERDIEEAIRKKWASLKKKGIQRIVKDGNKDK